MTIAEPQHYYYLLFACLLAEYTLIFRLLHSPLGTALRAMRENETACRTSGVDVTRVRVTLLLVSSAIAGAAGQPARAHERLHQPADVRLVDVGGRS